MLLSFPDTLFLFGGFYANHHRDPSFFNVVTIGNLYFRSAFQPVPPPPAAEVKALGFAVLASYCQSSSVSSKSRTLPLELASSSASLLLVPIVEPAQMWHSACTAITVTAGFKYRLFIVVIYCHCSAKASRLTVSPSHIRSCPS